MYLLQTVNKNGQSFTQLAVLFVSQFYENLKCDLVLSFYDGAHNNISFHDESPKTWTGLIKKTQTNNIWATTLNTIHVFGFLKCYEG